MKKEKKLSEEEEFEKTLQEVEDPKNNREVNYALPENATTLEKAKFEICQKILGYKLDNNLSREQVAGKIQLSKAETEDILFCHIEEFTLDRLMTYADRLFSPAEIKITVEKKETAYHAAV